MRADATMVSAVKSEMALATCRGTSGTLKQGFCTQDGRLAGHPERVCRLFGPANRKRSDSR